MHPFNRQLTPARASAAVTEALRHLTHRRRLLALAALLALAVLAPIPSASAAPPLFWQSCETGAAASQCNGPRSVAVAPLGTPNAGHIFVAEQNSSRVSEYTPWGRFVKAWGYNAVASGTDDTGGFEVCNVAVHPTDVCRAGEAKTGTGAVAGSFDEPNGIALDSAGDVYVYDVGTFRVQKFDPTAGPGEDEVHFLWMIGKNVNRTKAAEAGATQGEKDFCGEAIAEECQAGVSGTGPGEFSSNKVGDNLAVDDGEALFPEEVLWVGDQGRIQRFGTGSGFKGQTATASGSQFVQSLAADSAGDLYAAFNLSGQSNDEANVRKLGPTTSTATELCTFQVANPRAVTVAPNGDIYAFDKATAKIERFGSACNPPPALSAPLESFGEGLSPEFSVGLDTSAVCLTAGVNLYFSNSSGATAARFFLRAYGPPPDRFVGPGEICEPPPHPPEIHSQNTFSVGTDNAVVKAHINPKFWVDTAYRVQYANLTCLGSEEDWEAPCVMQTPEAELGAGAVDVPVPTAEVALAGLSPETAYRYRFEATSSGGGPVFGVGGILGEDGSSSALATSSATPPQPQTDCPNQALRYGASGLLSDCRAYEMVSPVDKEGANVKGGVNNQALPDGGRLTYEVGFEPAFAGEPSSRVANQYLAVRGSAGWANRGINAPLGRMLGTGSTASKVAGFSADLCSEWIDDDNFTPLDPSVPEGFVNLYRQDLCGAGGLEALTTAVPAAGAQPNYVGAKSVQGFSADGGKTFFAAKAKLTEDGSTSGLAQVYVHAPGEGTLHLVSLLPDGVADPGDSVSNSGAEIGGGRLFSFPLEGRLVHAVSADGTRAYWTSAVQQGNPGRQLYLRENPAAAPSPQLHGSASGSGDFAPTGKGNLTTGSTTVSGLVSAAGTGTLVAGSKEVTKLTIGTGRFVVGQPISGEGIPTGATVTSVTASTLMLSAAVKAGKSGENVPISSQGPAPFAIGQTLSSAGGGIPAGTTIVAVAPGSLTLSAPATASEGGAPLTAISEKVTGVVTASGEFQSGQSIVGEGIPLGTTITAVGAGTLTLSAKAGATSAGTALEAFSECTDPELACTIPVSSGKPERDKPGREAAFWTATPDGTHALYSEGPLATSGPGQATLHRFDASTQARPTLVGGLRGVLGASEDLSRIYYISTEALAGGAQAGAPNLYLEEEGAKTFIATLAEGAEGDTNSAAYQLGSTHPIYNTARVTPDGSRVVFESRAPLSGFDNTDLNTGEADVEVFTYEAGGALACVSCAASGVGPRGRVLENKEENQPTVQAAAWIPGSESPLYASNVLSSDGKRIFFNSLVPLVGRDGNGAQDVYEWEQAPNKATCEEAGADLYNPAAGGCISLISSGQNPSESRFIDASADGSDVFFTTAASLLPQDPGLIDIYDARSGGGFPQPTVPASCEGEACQSPPAPPNDPTPASSSFEGAGNAVETPAKPKSCKEPSVKKKGKCVKRHHKHQRSHRQAHHRRTHR
jgi:hypothetical protein